MITMWREKRKKNRENEMRKRHKNKRLLSDTGSIFVFSKKMKWFTTITHSYVCTQTT